MKRVVISLVILVIFKIAFFYFPRHPLSKP